MAASHPWFGIGLGTWPTVYPRYAIVDIGAFANQAHDDWWLPGTALAPELPSSNGDWHAEAEPAGARNIWRRPRHHR